MSRFGRDQGGPPQRVRVNHMIRISPVRVIGPDNEQIGVIETSDAIRRALEGGMDLVEISPEARPPVCKIMDYGKYKYELSQKQRKQRAATKSSEMKELRLGRSTKIDPHDLSIQLFQNGQLRQNSNTSQLIFNCFHLVSFISTNMTLLPGDVILTGTPSGIGAIESGDRLEVRIQGLAPLVNTVK